MARERSGQIDFARFDLAGERTMTEDRMTGDPSRDAPNGTATTTVVRGCSAKPDEIDNASRERRPHAKPRGSGTGRCGRAGKAFDQKRDKPPEDRPVLTVRKRYRNNRFARISPIHQSSFSKGEFHAYRPLRCV